MQKTMIIGVLGADAEIRYTKLAGAAYLYFSVAETERKKGGEEATTWYNCAGFGTRFAESKIVQYLKRGSKVFISGRNTPRAYIRANGEAAVSNDFFLDEIDLGVSTAVRAEAAASQPPADPVTASTPHAYNSDTLDGGTAEDKAFDNAVGGGSAGGGEYDPKNDDLPF